MAQTPVMDHILLVLARAHAARLHKRFMRAVANATRVQDRVLLEKVRRNGDSDFGRRHGFGRIRNYEDYRRQVPILDYEDLLPYVERLKRGEPRALLGPGEKVVMFALTSGTTAEPKYIPVTEHFLKEYRRGWNVFGVKALLDHPGSFLRPIVQITSPMDESRTEAGIPCGAITGLMAATQKRLVRKYYVTPREVAYIPDGRSRYYTIVRLAVAHDVAFLITASPATQLRLARTGDEHREHLVRDIHDGTLAEEFEVPAPIRASLAPRLRPRPDTARRLQRIIECAGRLLPKDYWSLTFLANWTGGTMGLYLHDFPEYFGDVPVRDIGLLASEGRMSVPVEDGKPAGILEVTSHFYEFIPSEQIDSPRPDTFRSHELEIGGEYFILLTTSSGLYRYHIGDQVRVVGYEGQAPVIEFLNKGAHVSSLSGEKVTERQAVLSVEALGRRTGARIDSFVLAPHWAVPPFYVLHVEPNALTEDPQRMAELMDEELRRINIEYDSKRKSGRLSAVQVNVLPPGHLRGLDRRASRRQGRVTDDQYKHQYLYTTPGQDTALCSAAPGALASGQRA
jgi:hypothetical protein